MIYGLGFVKGSEKYIFMYDDASKVEVLRVLGRFASNSELGDFTWFDAAVLSQKIRQEPCEKNRMNCCLEIVFDN